MDFKLSREQKMLRQMYRDFAQNEIKPIAAEIDEEERFPWETVKKMGELGMMGVYFPKEYGGAGADVLSYAMCVEEIGKVCGSTAIVVSSHTSLCCAPIFEFGTEEQKRKYLPDLLRGNKVGAFGLTEPSAGTDASGVQTTAVLDGDHYVLNGSKIFITNGGAAQVYVIFAMTDRSQGSRGISAFIGSGTSPASPWAERRKKWVSAVLPPRSS
jgi:butyryl-CoA dehydrogenase